MNACPAYNELKPDLPGEREEGDRVGGPIRREACVARELDRTILDEVVVGCE